MDWRTLFLSSSYEPLACATWQRAVSLVWVEEVDVVADYDAVVRSPSLLLHVPAVVRRRRYLRVPRRGVPFTRQNLLQGDNHQCQCCMRVQRPGELRLDPVIPRSRGGKPSWEDLVAACVRCNRCKAHGPPPLEAHRVLKRPPRRPPALAPGAGLVRAGGAPEEWRPYLPLRRAS